MVPLPSHLTCTPTKSNLYLDSSLNCHLGAHPVQTPDVPCYVPSNYIGCMWLILLFLGTFRTWDYLPIPIWKGVLLGGTIVAVVYVQPTVAGLFSILPLLYFEYYLTRLVRKLGAKSKKYCFVSMLIIQGALHFSLTSKICFFLLTN
jgi:hypothetical protein